MKANHINPFIESVYDLFGTMLNCQVARGDLAIAESVSQPRDITALIGLAGRTRGTVALSFPVTTALAMVSRLTDNTTRVVDATVLDAVAELVNIVAGGAKAKMTGEGADVLSLGLPIVVRGQRYNVDYPSNATWLEVPFSSDLGPFSLRVTFEYSIND